MSWPDVIAPRWPPAPDTWTLHRVAWPEGEERSGPISLDEARVYGRITETSEDIVAEMMLAGAIDYAETATKRAISFGLWDLVLDAFPAGNRIRLPRPPVVEVVELQHRDSDDAWQVIDALDYTVAVDGDFAEVSPLVGESWPGTSAEPRSVRIRYRAGFRPFDYEGSVYEAAPPLIGAHLKATICELFAFRFDDRGIGSDNRLIDVAVPRNVEAALWSERVDW